jgi:beta-mannosidase
VSGRLRACDSHQRVLLSEGWEASCGSGGGDTWLPAAVPGTAASSLRSAGQWSFDSTPREFDQEEWFFRTRFTADPAESHERVFLGFDGLATFAHVTLNDTALFESTNMFAEHRCDVSALLRPQNELAIRFSPLDPFLAARRGRARWRTPMVRHQQLRWIRTSLLGRTPGWSPPAAPVGPWRPVWLERQQYVQFGEHRLHSELTGADGLLRFSCELSALPGTTIGAVRLRATRGRACIEANLGFAARGLQGDLHLPNVDLWWPHTHGEPALYQVSLLIELSGSDVPRCIEADLGSVGFRSLRLDRALGRFTLYVNDHEVFCRGAAWMPLDCVSLQSSATDYSEAIDRVCNAGMNMLRVAGPTVYETDTFWDRCDAAGVMVWQDFMFANMDYPAADAAFEASVRQEVTQQLSRLQGRPSLAMLCGNSEGAQQAAMSGAARECWAPPLFEVELASLSNAFSPDVPYCPSSTHGGAFPFQPNEGVTSYYGVGAYFRPLSDARRSEVRFASECLAFANIPEDETLALLAPGHALRCHHPQWKQRVPRDLGAGWDFDDVRDYYLQQLFRVDPMQLRYADHDRYLQLGRVVSGEVMGATFAEWRRAASFCSGGLIWFLNDLWPGAGWGVIDSTGLPKAAYYHIKRVLQPLAVFVTDEDCNGLVVHVVNEKRISARARLELRLFRSSTPVGTLVAKTLDLDPRSSLQIPATDFFEGFTDLSYTFRFGPPSYDLMHAALYLADQALPASETFHFPQGLPNVTQMHPGLVATATSEGSTWRVKVTCKSFAQSVYLDAPGFVADDQYFHMAPNSTRTIGLTARRGVTHRSFEATLRALNAASPVAVECMS